MIKPRINLPPDAHRLIDEFMPIYDVSEYHEIRIRASIARVYDSLRRTDLGTSFIVRVLLRLRSLPDLLSRKGRHRESRIDFESLLKNGFVLLGENPPNEIALGLVGKFWTAAGGTCRLSSAEEFKAFEQAGYAKAVWNFSLVEEGVDATRLATETRVRCLDDGGRWVFRLYWSVIAPFSGLIRGEVLRAIRNATEGRSQRSEVRGQKSEVRSQRSEVRGQKSDC
ncbi:MAG TPA: hypothetical protein VN937_28910 [Blastocatellia bacterium]|nr:hypothetical protein [Blastocatellia bacterium]